MSVLGRWYPLRPMPSNLEKIEYHSFIQGARDKCFSVSMIWVRISSMWIYIYTNNIFTGTPENLSRKPV